MARMEGRAWCGCGGGAGWFKPVSDQDGVDSSYTLLCTRTVLVLVMYDFCYSLL
jgi:hypothetical protein